MTGVVVDLEHPIVCMSIILKKQHFHLFKFESMFESLQIAVFFRNFVSKIINFV